MRLVILIFTGLLTVTAYSQQRNHSISAFSEGDCTFTEIRECIVNSKVFPKITNANYIRVTPLLVGNSLGVYAFAEKGPHRFNQLVIQEFGKCNVFPKDSSSSYVRTEIEKFIKRNRLNSKIKKKLRKDIEDYIISFKEHTL